nr:immunoglobulin light chain junction region [Macaca mulatta]MPN86785.1 immunoglobulin light chain junction region [Macaca mulatta]MPN86810.1 immunoglobulin light chain junction region [Macaca mulatta]MPN86823.1 immunoglobulin light chain junction region [Macaca mulatta]MPN86836.1 immunoglobulin light chain junction region [Macaca mulatta]
CQQCNTNPWTF